MNRPPKYVIISPVRDEAKYLPRLIRALQGQTITPAKWIIVNDGSKDQTGAIADEAQQTNDWIQVIHRSDRGFRQAGGGVIDAFYKGFEVIADESWDFVVKLDGDLSFEPDYFEQCFRQFEHSPRLGIGGGVVCGLVGGKLEEESKGDPRFHVRGATKIYRRGCWEKIGGLIRAPGWDTLDEVKANMLGWETRTFSEIKLEQHRPTGAAYGAWKDRVKSGLANYIAGYHPVFMVAKCLGRMLRKPYLVGGFGLLFGFVKGYAKRIPQVPDRELIKYFRQQQINRLLGRRSLWG